MRLEEIKRILPHRYPMLLVDAIREVVPGESLTAVKAVSANEPWYADLPDLADPAYPPVLLIESWCQAAGILAAWDKPNADVLTGKVMLFGSLSGVSLHRPVWPGDVLTHRVRIVRELTDTLIVEGESLAGTEQVLTVERVVMALRDAADLRPAPEDVPEEEKAHA